MFIQEKNESIYAHKELYEKVHRVKENRAWLDQKEEKFKGAYGNLGGGVNVFIILIVVKVLVAQSCPTLCDPMDCSPPGSSVHGISQIRILEWLAIPFSRGSSWPRDWTQVSCIAGRFFTIWTTREVLTVVRILQIYKYLKSYIISKLCSSF